MSAEAKEEMDNNANSGQRRNEIVTPYLNELDRLDPR
jgi:hypothetical protein